MVKRCVFRRSLKISSEGKLWMLAGSQFHSVGAAIVKDRSPRVVDDLIAGCSRLIELLDLSERSGWRFTFISSEMYVGAREWIALNVIKRTLKVIRYHTGNQWRSYRRGYDGVKQGERCMSLAALFWTRCSCERGVWKDGRKEGCCNNQVVMWPVRWLAFHKRAELNTSLCDGYCRGNRSRRKRLCWRAWPWKVLCRIKCQSFWLQRIVGL